MATLMSNKVEPQEPQSGRIRLGDYLAPSKRMRVWSLFLFIAWVAVGIVSWSFLRTYIGETNVGVVIWEADHIVLLVPTIVLFVLSVVYRRRGWDSFLERIRSDHFSDGPLKKRAFYDLLGADASALSRYGFDAEKLEFEFEDYVQATEMVRKHEKFNKFDLKDRE
jgi:hypothetical protein